MADELDALLNGEGGEGDELDRALAEFPLPAKRVEASPITSASRPPEARGGGEALLPDGGAGAAGLLGAGDSLWFGFADEALGFLQTIDPSVRSRETVWNSSRGFSATLSSNIAKNRQEMAQAREQHGTAMLVGNVAGGLVIPFGAGARGALQVGKVGAVQGAIYGVGSGEGLGDRIEEGVKGGLIGGAVGAVLGRFLPGLKKSQKSAIPETTTSYSTSPPKDIPEGAATVAGPDGTVYATRADDGAELVGFGRNEDGSSFPQYGIPPKTGAADDVVEEVADDVPLEAPPRTPDEAPTPVGSIGRPQLQALQDDVARFRADPNYTPDLPAGSPQGQWRIGNIGEAGDAQNLLSALARQLPPSPVKSDEELVTSAQRVMNALGEDDHEAVLAWARNTAGTLGDVDNTMMALRSVWAQAGKQVDEFHMAGVDWSQADDTLVLSAGQAIRNLSELSHQVQIAKAGLGRGLRVNQLPTTDEYLKLLLGKADEAAETGADAAATPGATPPVPPRTMPPLPRNRKELQDWFELWSLTGGDKRAQSDFLQGLLTVPKPGKYLRTSVANLFTASILSAPRTVAMNIVGPSLVSLVRNAERFGGAAAGAINPFASAEQRAAMRIVARETPIAYLRTLGDIADAFRYGVEAGTRNRSILGGGSSTTDALASYGPLTNNLLGVAGAEPDLRYTLGNLLNVFPKAFARLNNGLDETAKRLSYMGEVRVRAQVEAAQQGLSGDAMQAFVRDRLKKSFDEVGHATDTNLLRSAERTTFTAQVGEEGGWMRRFGNGIQGLRRDIPETRFIVPVFNVPANALGETMRRVPLANRLLKVHAADLAGDNGVVAQAEAHGRTLLGGSFLMAGVMLNRMGLVTGAGPQEATDRKVWLQTHQPYSIRVGDTWVRYDKFDLLGGLLSIPATISDASTYRAADKGIEDMMTAGAGALAQWFKDKAALRTAAALLNAGSDPTSDFGTVLNQFAGSTAAGFIPNAFRTLGVDTTDEYVRMRRDWTDYLKASIPGLSQTLEPQRNVLGEPIQRSADTFAEAVFPVTMQSAVTYADDPVMDELARIYETTGYGAGADPKSLGYGFFNPKDVKLEDGRSLYDRAMQKRMVMKVDGQDLRTTLRTLFDSAAYNAGVDADPNQKVTSLGDASRGYMVRQVFDKFNKAAKAELATESAAADAYLTAAAAKQRDDAYLRDVSAEDLVKTPRLYQDRGINAQAYSSKIKGVEGDPLLSALGLQ